MVLLRGRVDFMACKALLGWETGSSQPLTVSVSTLVRAHTDTVLLRKQHQERYRRLDEPWGSGQEPQLTPQLTAWAWAHLSIYCQQY